MIHLITDAHKCILGFQERPEVDLQNMFLVVRFLLHSRLSDVERQFIVSTVGRCYNGSGFGQ